MEIGEHTLWRLLDASGLGTWLWEPGMPVLRLEAPWPEAPGHSGPGEVQQVTWDLIIHPDDLPAVESARAGLTDGSEARCTCDYRMARTDGGYNWVRERSAVVSLPGENLKMAGILEDIHEMKLAEHRLEVQRSLGGTIASCRDYRTALAGALDVLSSLPPFDDGAALVPGETGELYPAVQGNSSSRMLDILAGSLPADLPECRHSEGSPVYWSPFGPDIGEAAPACACLLPVVFDGRTIAILLFTSRDADQVPQESREVLGSVSHWIGRALSMILTMNHLEEMYGKAREDAETRAELLREVNHRVKNNLAAIVGLLYAEKRFLDPEQAEVWAPVQKDLIGRIEGLAVVHSILSAGKWAPVPLSDLAERIVNQAMKVLPPGKRLCLSVKPSPVVLRSDLAHHLGMLLNELAANTLKYAVPCRDVVQVDVDVEVLGDMVRMTYRDDGPGFPPDALSMERHSLGFELIGNIVRSVLGGVLSLRNDGGAVVTIEFSRRRVS